jgi:hypothetical protein
MGGNLGGTLRTVDWTSQRLERFEKNFYVEDKRVTARSDAEIDEFRRVKEMKVRGFARRGGAGLRMLRRYRCKAATSRVRSPLSTKSGSPTTS